MKLLSVGNGYYWMGLEKIVLYRIFGIEGVTVTVALKVT